MITNISQKDIKKPLALLQMRSTRRCATRLWALPVAGRRGCLWTLSCKRGYKWWNHWAEISQVAVSESRISTAARGFQTEKQRKELASSGGVLLHGRCVPQELWQPGKHRKKNLDFTKPLQEHNFSKNFQFSQVQLLEWICDTLLRSMILLLLSYN